MRPKVITLTIVLGIALAGLLDPGRQPSYGQEQDRSRLAQLICCNVSVWIPPWPKYVAGYSTDCKGYLRTAPPKVQEDICKQMGEKGLICPDTASYCAPKPKCQKYSGEITCDCNGDGKDETTKSFESCGLPANWPTSFRSRCEDWITSEGFGYGTDTAIQREGSDYLNSLKCPALKCQRQYKTCEREANEKYEKCSFGRNFVGIGRDCLLNQTTALNKCAQNRDKCLNEIRKSGPGPRPQPLPTPPATGINLVVRFNSELTPDQADNSVSCTVSPKANREEKER